MDANALTAQQRFDETYITSSEICAELEVTRSTVVMGNRRGLLPGAISVNRPLHGAHIIIWERSTVRPFIDAWKIALQSRRGQLK